MQSNIEQLCVCAVKIRHKNKCVKYRFFVVPGDSPIMLGMPDIELLNILRITCDTIGGYHESRKFNSQTVETSDSPDCRIKEAPQFITDKEDMHAGKRNMSDYFRLITDRVEDKRASELLINKIHNEFSDLFIFRDRLL